MILKDVVISLLKAGPCLSQGTTNLLKTDSLKAFTGTLTNSVKETFRNWFVVWTSATLVGLTNSFDGRTAPTRRRGATIGKAVNI